MPSLTAKERMPGRHKSAKIRVGEESPGDATHATLGKQSNHPTHPTSDQNLRVTVAILRSDGAFEGRGRDVGPSLGTEFSKRDLKLHCVGLADRA